MAVSRNLPDILTPLTDMQRIYVQCRLQGMSKTASATAAGASDPGKYLVEVEQSVAVQEALRDARRAFAEDVDFSRREAHDMLMQAFRNASTAGEQVSAVQALMKLHGIEAPTKHEHHHNHHVTVEKLPDSKLLELAGMDNPLLIEGEFTVLPDEIHAQELPRSIQ